MGIGLLIGSDEMVARHFLEPRGQMFFKYDRAFGILRDEKLVGTILIHGFNGSNLELSYYGEGTMTAGVIRFLAKYGVKTFDPSRCTVITSKRNRRFIKSLQRLGFKLEGTQRCYYGKKDIIRNTGVRFVMFREQIDALAKLGSEYKEAI